MNQTSLEQEILSGENFRELRSEAENFVLSKDKEIISCSNLRREDGKYKVVIFYRYSKK